MKVILYYLLYFISYQIILGHAIFYIKHKFKIRTNYKSTEKH